MRTYRVAVVGTGGIAEAAHVPAIRAAGERAKLVTAVDTDPARLAVFQQKTGVPVAYQSLKSMLRTEKPDLVQVCTPPSTHADIAIACLDAGAWVLLEKPPALSLAEYDRITAAERDGGPYASVVFQHRFGSGARHARELIGAGVLGRPLVAVCHTTWFRDQSYFDVPWRGKWATEGGGPTMGHGIHQIDLLLALLGEWTEVRAMAGRLDRVMETEDVSMAIVRFASGAMASIVNSVLSPREESYLRLDLTDATVEVTHLYGYRNADWRYTPAPHVTDERLISSWSEVPEDVNSSHSAQLPFLLDAMDRGQRPPLSGPQGREALELITALYRSAFTGAPVTRDQLRPGDVFYHRMNGDVKL